MGAIRAQKDHEKIVKFSHQVLWRAPRSSPWRARSTDVPFHSAAGNDVDAEGYMGCESRGNVDVGTRAIIVQIWVQVEVMGVGHGRELNEHLKRGK